MYLTERFSKNQWFNCTKKLEYWLISCVDLCMFKQMLYDIDGRVQPFFTFCFSSSIYYCTCAFRALVGLVHQLFTLC